MICHNAHWLHWSALSADTGFLLQTYSYLVFHFKVEKNNCSDVQTVKRFRETQYIYTYIFIYFFKINRLSNSAPTKNLDFEDKVNFHLQTIREPILVPLDWESSTSYVTVITILQARYYKFQNPRYWWGNFWILKAKCCQRKRGVEIGKDLIQVLRQRENFETVVALPWLIWLSGLSTVLWTKGSLVRFPVRAHAWVVGQVPGRGCSRGDHTLVFPPSLSPSPL